MKNLPAWVEKEIAVSQRMEAIASKLSSRAWIVALIAAFVMTTPVFFTSHGDWTVLGVMIGIVFLGLGMALKVGARRTLLAAQARRKSAIGLAGKPLDD